MRGSPRLARRRVGRDIWCQSLQLVTTSTLVSASNVAADLRGLGDYEGARALDEDTLTRARRVLGDDHPDTLTSASNLATDLHQLGEVQRAETLEDEVRRRRERD